MREGPEGRPHRKVILPFVLLFSLTSKGPPTRVPIIECELCLLSLIETGSVLPRSRMESQSTRLLETEFVPSDGQLRISL